MERPPLRRSALVNNQHPRIAASTLDDNTAVAANMKAAAATRPQVEMDTAGILLNNLGKKVSLNENSFVTTPIVHPSLLDALPDSYDDCYNVATIAHLTQCPPSATSISGSNPPPDTANKRTGIFDETGQKTWLNGVVSGPLKARLDKIDAKNKANKRSKTASGAAAVASNLDKNGSYDDIDADDEPLEVAVDDDAKKKPLPKFHGYSLATIKIKHMTITRVYVEDSADDDEPTYIVSAICGHPVSDKDSNDKMTVKMLRAICQNNKVAVYANKRYLKKGELLLELAMKKIEIDNRGTHAAAVKAKNPEHSEEFRLINIVFSEFYFERFMETKRPLDGPELTEERIEKKSDVFWQDVAESFNSSSLEEFDLLAYEHRSFTDINPTYCGEDKTKESALAMWKKICAQYR
jgi:hypothetical protein